MNTLRSKSIRRNLLIVVIVVTVVEMVVLVRQNFGSHTGGAIASPVEKVAHQVTRTHTKKTTHTSTRKHPATSHTRKHPAKSHAKTSHPVKRPTVVHAQPTLSPQAASLRAYALAVRPYLGQATGLFDAVVRQASSGDFGQMNAACSNHATQVQQLHDQIAGIPQDQPIGSPSANLQSQAGGTVGFMQGAMEECTMAVENNDSGSASTALSDLREGSSRMHRLYNRVWQITHNR